MGDINFFLYPDDEEPEEAEDGIGQTPSRTIPACCIGEVDIMIATAQDRGQGVGKAAVSAFLHYILRNIADILLEYQSAGKGNDGSGEALRLKRLMVKIKAENVASIALFKGLGFEQQGEVNYFGEVKMVLDRFDRFVNNTPDSYQELPYR